MSLTLAESMAMAVIKGDLVAAYALSDLLQEQRDNPNNLEEQAAIAVSKNRGMPLGYTVYGWPEFKTLCNRLGIAWSLRTRDMTIKIPHEGFIEIEQSYVGVDTGEQG